MIKKSSLIMVLLLSPLILFACGNKESTTSTEADMENAEQSSELNVSDLESILSDNYTYTVTIRTDSEETGTQERTLTVYRYQSTLVYWIDQESAYFLNSDSNEVGIYTKSTNALTIMSGDLFNLDDALDESLFYAPDGLDFTEEMYLKDDTFDGNKVKVYDQNIGTQSVTAYYNPQNMLMVKVDYQDETMTSSYELTGFEQNTVTEADVAYPADADVSDLGDYSDMLNEYQTTE